MRFHLQRTRALLGLAIVGVMTAACGPTIKVASPAEMTSVADATAPDFTAVDHRGESISLAEANRESTVVLVFYRGAW